MLAGALARFFEPEDYGPPASAGPPSLQGPARQFLTDPSSHPLAALAPFLCKAWFARRIPRSRGSSSPARFAHFMLVFLYRERMQKKELFSQGHVPWNPCLFIYRISIEIIFSMIYRGHVPLVPFVFYSLSLYIADKETRHVRARLLVRSQGARKPWCARAVPPREDCWCARKVRRSAGFLPSPGLP